MKLIVNADDFGYSRGVNWGIVDAHRHGVVSSATMMVNMPAFAHAVELGKENPQLGIGVHLVLTCGQPVHPTVPTLTDESGAFRRGQQHLMDARPEEIEQEWTAQIERFLQSGLELTHLDSHHHVHAHPAVLPIMLRLAKKYDVPIRNPWALTESGQKSDQQVSCTEGFSPRFYGEALTVDTFIDIVEELQGCISAEVMTHPAYLDEAVRKGSSYSLPRMRELEILLADEVKAYMRAREIQLVTFNDIG